MDPIGGNKCTSGTRDDIVEEHDNGESLLACIEEVSEPVEVVYEIKTSVSETIFTGYRPISVTVMPIRGSEKLSKFHDVNHVSMTYTCQLPSCLGSTYFY